MGYQKLFERIADEFSAKILNWAVKKTGSRPDGEDLAQEVLMQVFTAVAREEKVEKLENFVWKVAHYVWCNKLRKLSRYQSSHALLDEAVWDGLDFVDELIGKEAVEFELNRIRRKIADLSRAQREAMILHYLDGLSISDVSERLNTTVSAVKWHLFDARKKMREELECMKEDSSYVYRPGRLCLGLYGIPGPDPDTRRVNESLTRQNICLLCYRESRTVDEISELAGIPKPYLEYDLEWLVSREFLSLDGRKYSTVIPIIGRKHRQDIGGLYSKTRADYIDRIIEYLYSREADIRKIGFYGADFKLEKLMWPIIMMFLSYFSRNSEAATSRKKVDESAIRPDGGKYYVIGNDFSDNQDLNPEGYFNPEGWNDFYGICSDSCMPNGEYETYYWLGVYNFIASECHPAIIKEKNKVVQSLWHKLLCSLTEKGFNTGKLSGDEKEKLAAAVRDGLVAKTGDKYEPNFVIMSREELKQLQQDIFMPLLSEIEPKTGELAKLISGMHSKNMPRVNRKCVDYLTYLDLWYFGIYALTFAAQDGKLFIPPTPREGAALTLVLIK